MSSKNETLPLLLALFLTATALGGGLWWFSKYFQNAPVNPSAPNAQNAPATFRNVPQVPNGRFRYGGSTTFAPIRALVDAEIIKQLPQFQLIYVDPVSGTPGSGKGIEMLLGNQLAFSQSSRTLKDKERQAAQTQGYSLEEIAVAIDGIAVAVNPELPIPGLTVAQLKAIYTGKLTNWQAVGGPNLPIIPYSRSLKDGGTVEFFHDQVLEKEDFGKNVVYVHSTTPGLQKVSQNLGGIYYASAPEVVPQCSIRSLPLARKTGEWITPYQEPYLPTSNCPQRRNRLNQEAFQTARYPITRNIFIIVKKNGREEEQAGLAYANLLRTQEGQTLIQQAGFVPLR
jgi:phosphate transport system substrate-binding protein